MRIAVAQNRIAIADALQSALALRPGHEIVWVARTGIEALHQCERQRPDLLLMEPNLPVMSGIEATRRIMSVAPCAILIVTCGVANQASQILEAIGDGALDAVDMLLVKRALISSIVDFRKKIDGVAAMIAGGEDFFDPDACSRRVDAPPLIAIGASAGGPAAIATILQGLPADFPCALIIVQHVDPRLVPELAQWLQGHSRLKVGVARENDAPERGVVLLASPKAQLRLKRPDRVGYTGSPQAHYQRRIDAFFESVSTFWRGRAAGVLLTGVGRDGASGLRALCSKGHHTIAQDQDTSVAYEMPGAAIALGAAVDVLPLKRIAGRLVEFSRTMEPPIDRDSQPRIQHA